MTIIDHYIQYLGDAKPMIQEERDKLMSSLDKIDERISELDVDEVNRKIKTEEEKITTRREQLKKIEELKVEVTTYDPTATKTKRTEQDKMKDSISTTESEMSKFDLTLAEHKSHINTINMDTKNIIDGHIRLVEDEVKENDVMLSKVKDVFSTMVMDYTSVLKQDINDVISKKDTYKKDMDGLMEEGKRLKKLNDELETSKVCVTCERPLDGVDPEVINKKVEANKVEMGNIMTKIKDIKPKYDDMSKGIDDLRDKLDKLTKKDYTFDEKLNKEYHYYLGKKEDTETTNTEIVRRVILIKDGNFPNELQIKLKSSYDEKRKINEAITEVEEKKKGLERTLINKKNELMGIMVEINRLEAEDMKVHKKKEAIALEEKVKADIERCENAIVTHNRDILEFNKEIGKIKGNRKTMSDIALLNTEMTKLEDGIKERTTVKSKVESSIAVIDNEIKKLSIDIKIFESQLSRDEVLDAYMKCVHRDGLPTYLLKKSIHIINQELGNILVDVDFNLYFDEELTLKLAHDIKAEASQNAIESSGMERTFAAIALKMALRKINNKSKPNFIMLDEIMLKLLNASVDKFIVLLDNIKTQVDKLVIIEHIHPINYDVLIEVTKDEQGISSLKIED